VIPALRNPSFERKCAAKALCGIRNEAAFDALFEALFDSREISPYAYSALCCLDSPKAKEIRPLAEVVAKLETARDIDQCYDAVKAAASLGDPRAVRSLVPLIETWLPRLDPSFRSESDYIVCKRTVRETIVLALKTLRALGGEEAGRALEKYGHVVDKDADTA